MSMNRPKLYLVELQRPGIPSRRYRIEPDKKGAGRNLLVFLAAATIGAVMGLILAVQL